MLRGYKMMTVGLILEGDKILLGMKKKGFGVGRWNGFGGKFDGSKDKSIDDTVDREFWEESSIKVLEHEKMGMIDFEFEGQDEILQVHFYRITKYYGKPMESDEMMPKWFEIKDIPYDLMWPDDKYWMPIFLKGKKFWGKIYFKDQNTILKADIKELMDVKSYQ
jgi:8-oxo-dGTP diphosphatase/2-hydroxy-dATP diphosphatase